MERVWGLLACVGLCLQAAIAWAEALPMAKRASLFTQASPLIIQTAVVAPPSPSLFVGTSGNSLFAPSPVSIAPPALFRSIPTPGVGPVGQLRSLIARAEAGPDGYDAVQYGATIRPDSPPTSLTLQEIFDWIEETPGQPHAVGRYQFIPPTLRRLVARLGISPEARFTPRVQDQLADLLLKEAGLPQFLSGEIGRQKFMNNLAEIWAGLPNDTGKSRYDGYAGNKATMTWAGFDAQMARIFPG